MFARAILYQHTRQLLQLNLWKDADTASSLLFWWTGHAGLSGEGLYRIRLRLLMQKTHFAEYSSYYRCRGCIQSLSWLPFAYAHALPFASLFLVPSPCEARIAREATD